MSSKKGVWESALAVAMLTGTIIGVGMFGLPFTASRSGFLWFFLYLAGLAAVVTAMHLIYGEIVLRTNRQHRLPGYARIYLGRWGQGLATVVFFVTMYLALLAYLLIGGEFLSIILSSIFSIAVSPAASAMILAVIGFGIVFIGLKITGVFEFIMTVGLVGLILGVTIYGFSFIDKDNLTLVNQSANLFLPYGIILFSLSGGSAIPEIRNFFGRGRAHLFKKVIIAGTVISAAVYGFFTWTVVGISGPATTTEAIRGLAPFLGRNFLIYGAVIGFLAVITSFFTIALNVKNSLNFDFGLSRNLSFALTAAIPLGLYLSGFNNFIKILSFSGAVMGGGEGLLLIALWRRARKKGQREPEYSLKLKFVGQLILVLVFLAGIFYEVFYFK